MTTVDDVAVESGVPVADVLAACQSLHIVASSPGSGLSRAEHEQLRTALGAPADLPPVAGGSTERVPDAPAGADTRTLRERHDELTRSAPRRSFDPRKVSRYAVYTFLVIAVLVAVVTLRGAGESSGSRDAVVPFTTADEGACVDLHEGGGRSQVEPVDCATGHDAELYEVATTPGDADAAFPGGSALEDDARRACTDRFTAYVGRPYAESALGVVFLVPTPRTWDLGDRAILCLVEDPDAPLVGSVRGADR